MAKTAKVWNNFNFIFYIYIYIYIYVALLLTENVKAVLIRWVLDFLWYERIANNARSWHVN